MSKNWKNVERRVAAKAGSERTPLSGGNSKITRSDSLHERLFIETKYRKKHAVIALWDRTKILADKEGKIPVVALAERGRKGFWWLIHVDDLDRVSLELRTPPVCNALTTTANTESIVMVAGNSVGQSADPISPKPQVQILPGQPKPGETLPDRCRCVFFAGGVCMAPTGGLCNGEVLLCKEYLEKP